MDEYLIIGEVVRAQGIRGELKVKPLTDDPARFEKLTHVYTEKGSERRRVSAVRVREGFVYLRLEGVDSREDAENARGMLLYIDRENAVTLPEGSNFICDLIGCEVFGEDGTVFGTLTDVLQPGASDIYVITSIKDGKKSEMLLPALKHIVTDVDVCAKRILVDGSRLAEVAVIAD